jgi:hypothetical protein
VCCGDAFRLDRRRTEKGGVLVAEEGSAHAASDDVDGDAERDEEHCLRNSQLSEEESGRDDLPLWCSSLSSQLLWQSRQG